MPDESLTLKRLRKDLLRAAQTGDSSAFLNLVIRDGEALIHPGSSDTVLHIASRNGHLEVVRVILENLKLGHLLTSANKDGKCALHEAAQNLQCDVAQYLIDQGTPADILKRADWTPLMLACTRDHSSDMIEMLLKNGAQVSIRNKDGWTAFHVATRKGNGEGLRTLLNHDSNCWNTRSNNGRTPLHTAAIHGHAAVLKVLLDCSLAFTDSEDSCGTTPLMDAARSGSRLCCLLLLDSGANLDHKDKIGRNALCAAAEAGSARDVLDLLRDRGLDVNCLTDNGQTPLHLAARESHSETMKHLLNMGADYAIRDNSGAAAKDMAIQFNNEHILNVLPTGSAK